MANIVPGLPPPFNGHKNVDGFHDFGSVFSHHQLESKRNATSAFCKDIIHVPNMARVPPSSGVIYLARSFQLSMVSLLTSPASKAIVLLQMLYFCLNFLSQLLEATKSEISNFSAINAAFSWSIDPETGMLGFLYIVYQSHTA